MANLKEGWNGSNAPRINLHTRKLAKSIARLLPKLKLGKWTASPCEDGSVLFKGKNAMIMVGRL